MSQSSVYNIVAFCFADRHTADEVAKEVRKSQKLENYRVVVEAVVEVDEKGKTHIHEPGRGGLGASVGAVAGGLLALIGGVAGKYLGRTIPAKELKALGEQMQPNSSAFMAIVEDVDAENVLNDMAGYSANVITLTVGDELSGQIAAAVAADVEIDAAQD